jgi:glycosyltransferase involved in cell wall biosynthesis
VTANVDRPPTFAAPAELHVLHAVAALSEGGIGVAVPRLCGELARQGLRVTLVSLAPASGGPPEAPGAAIELFRPSRPHAVCFSWEMLRRLAGLVEHADVVHIHSNWTFPVWWAGLTARRRGKPCVMTPHGCLLPERLRVSAARKRVAGAVFDRRLLAGAALLHAASDIEAASFRGYGLVNRTVVIPFGVDEPADAAEIAMPDTRRRSVLFLGRLHPIKGLPDLVRAWAQVKADRPSDAAAWRVIVAGPDEGGHRRDIEAEARRLRLAVAEASPERVAAPDADIVFTGPVRAADKWRLYRAADLFVLPSLAENFGLVVPEALICGVPVIATRATPWAELEGAGHAHGRCGWWVEGGVAPLARALQEAVRMTAAARRDLGANGARLARARYRWSEVAAATRAAYLGVLQA